MGVVDSALARTFLSTLAALELLTPVVFVGLLFVSLRPLGGSGDVSSEATKVLGSVAALLLAGMLMPGVAAKCEF